MHDVFVVTSEDARARQNTPGQLPRRVDRDCGHPNFPADVDHAVDQVECQCRDTVSRTQRGLKLARNLGQETDGERFFSPNPTVRKLRHERSQSSCRIRPRRRSGRGRSVRRGNGSPPQTRASRSIRELGANGATSASADAIDAQASLGARRRQQGQRRAGDQPGDLADRHARRPRSAASGNTAFALEGVAAVGLEPNGLTGPGKTTRRWPSAARTSSPLGSDNHTFSALGVSTTGLIPAEGGAGTPRWRCAASRSSRRRAPSTRRCRAARSVSASSETGAAL